MLSLLPMVKVLFDEGEKIRVKPVFNGMKDFDLHYIENYLNYYITTLSESKGPLITLITVVGFVLSTFFLKNLFSYLSILYMTYLNNGILKDLRQDVYRKVITLNVGFFSNERKGDLIARMTSDINTIKSSFMNVLMIIREPLTILFTLIGMIAISWKLTVFVFFFIPISGFLISKLGKGIKSQSGNIFALEGHLISNIEETLGGIKISASSEARNATSAATSSGRPTRPNGTNASRSAMVRPDRLAPASSIGV